MTGNLGFLKVGGMLLALGALSFSLAGADGPPEGKGRPKSENLFDEKTPLQKAIEKSLQERREGERRLNPSCQQAIDDDDADRIAKFCKVPKMKAKRFTEAECGDCGDLVNAAGKVIGKRVKTETELFYEEPAQRGKVRWDAPMVKRPGLGEPGNEISNRGLGRPGRSNVRTAAMFPENAINDDRDCTDSVTGQRLGGPAAPDGAVESCFDVGGALKQTLEPAPGGCRHVASGTMLRGDDRDGLDDPCFDEHDALKTSLIESIDEDGVEEIDDDSDGLVDEDPANGLNDDMDCLDRDTGEVQRDASCYAGTQLLAGKIELLDEDDFNTVDQDGDGRLNEDGAEDPALGCESFGQSLGQGNVRGRAMPDGSCDLTPVIVAELNRRAQGMPRTNGEPFTGKLFVDCDPADPACDAEMLDGQGSMSAQFGVDEMRKVRVSETLTLRCEDAQAELVDGQCVSPAPPTAEQAFSLSASGAALVEGQARETLNGDGTKTIRQYMMMGFTFAPPVLEWGYRIEEDACVDLGFFTACFEVFFARLGYEFDVAVGLRLPVEVEISDIPVDSILAGQDLTLHTKVTPVDFTARQYEDFCEQNDLADGTLISDCERFSFPNFFDVIDPFLDPSEWDGDELVAHEVIFAGLIVRLLGIPVIQWGIDSAVDLPSMCSFLSMYQQSDHLGIDLLGFGQSLAETGDLRLALKDQLVNCGSFTTPFGLEQDPNALPGVERLRAFPFAATYEIGADCVQARLEGKVVRIGKKEYPICTNMLLGVNGASLGIGLGLDAQAGSTLITADWAASGDADPSAGGTDPSVRYRHSPAEGENEPGIGPIRVDNYGDMPLADQALVTLDDFTYYLNALQLGLTAHLQFGGILSPIPDIGSFRLYNFIIDGDTIGIPIGQHAGTQGIEVPITVQNYGLELEVAAAPSEPDQRIDDQTLQVKPGEFGRFEITANNLGSFPGNFDNFTRVLSNRPDQSAPFTFVINRNTDFDCTDDSGNHHRGYPYDALADDCYDGAGNLLAGRTESVDEDPVGPAGGLESERDDDADGSADEDPVDDWRSLPDEAGLATQVIADVPAYAASSTTAGGERLFLSISPFRHPLTAPGVYAFQVRGDSVEARALGMAATDPSGNARLGATAVAFVEVVSFYDPGVAVDPGAASGLAGEPRSYTVEVSNQGNAADGVLLSTRLVDSNQGACSVVDLGRSPGCPYRAVPTAIEPGWTDVDDLPDRFDDLEPLATRPFGTQVLVPRDWAGMQDTTYQFALTVTSEADPAASNVVIVEHTVSATSESMTRYIGLEIEALIADVEAANAEGYSTAGLLPILSRPISDANQRALEATLAGDLSGAAQKHASTIKVVEGFIHALDGSGRNLPAVMTDDWQARATAILGDLALAQATAIPSAP